MKSVFVVCLIALFSVNLSNCDDLQIGNSMGTTLVYLENVKLGSLPFTTRTKNVFFSSSNNQSIRAITAIDLDKSKAAAKVTAGGVGSSFVNIKIKSERGDGLNYQVQIFA